MYNSIISKAIRKNVAQDAGTTTSAGSYGGLPKRGGTSNSKYGGDGRVTVGLSTSSSMRSHEQGGMPHLIPQKTNVLTGAATKYFANQPSSWK